MRALCQRPAQQITHARALQTRVPVGPALLTYHRYSLSLLSFFLERTVLLFLHYLASRPKPADWLASGNTKRLQGWNRVRAVSGSKPLGYGRQGPIDLTTSRPLTGGLKVFARRLLVQCPSILPPLYLSSYFSSSLIPGRSWRRQVEEGEKRTCRGRL